MRRSSPLAPSMSDCAVLTCSPELGTSFHHLPKDPVQRQKWLGFIYKYRVHVSDHNNNNMEGLRVCSAHFSDDSFQNYMQKAMGFAKKLILKHDAVPTVYPDDAGGSRHVAAISLSRRTVACQSLPVRAHEVGLQCCPPAKSLRTVGTQLSEGTLRHRRSHGVQTILTMKEVGTEQPLPDHHGYQEDQESLSDPESSSDAPSDAISEESGSSESTSDVSKYVVYDSSLLRLLDRCPTCSHECQVNTQVKGSFLSVRQQCQHCDFSIQHSEGHLD